MREESNPRKMHFAMQLLLLHALIMLQKIVFGANLLRRYWGPLRWMQEPT